MELEEEKSVIKNYIEAYNSFDIEAMLALIHPRIQFTNVSNGVVTVSANGRNEFRELAEQSKKLFSFREQTITAMRSEGKSVMTDISYYGVLASDLPNGMKAGETLELSGKSHFELESGQIIKLSDIS